MLLIKYIPHAIGVAVVIIVIYILISLSDVVTDTVTVTDTERSLRKMKKEVNPNNFTQPESWFEAKADQVYVAMKGWGTNPHVIYRALKALGNYDDWLQLNIAFGEKDKQGLTTWLSVELDGWEIDEVRSILKKIYVSY